MTKQVVDYEAKFYALKALNNRIKVLTESVNHLTKSIRDEEHALRTKKHKTYDAGGGIGVSTEYNEQSSIKMVKEFTVKKAAQEATLAGYRHARDVIDSL